ncbi:MAG: flagellar hook-basal body complex protein FliE [candidate division Zixibacteria bacterium]|nr:flagellar hook-basal body complex protein FliE [candidate division Zixibacteria bacterium]
MNGISIIRPPLGPVTAGISQPKAAPEGKESFGDLLSKAITDVNDLQSTAATAQDKLVRGDAAELHQVMIAAEKAGISFDLLLEVRKRLVEAYQELSRMQV